MDMNIAGYMVNGEMMTTDQVTQRVLDRLGVNDGIYEFAMNDFGKILAQYGYTRTHPNGYGKINFIKYLRTETPFHRYGLKETKDCSEGNLVISAHFTARERDDFIKMLKRFSILEGDYIFTKKEEQHGK